MTPHPDELEVWTITEGSIGGPVIEYVITVARDDRCCPWHGERLKPHRTAKQWGWISSKRCGYYRKMRRDELLSATEHMI